MKWGAIVADRQLRIGCDESLKVDGFKTASTGAFLNSGVTMTAQLYRRDEDEADQLGASVGSEVTLSYVASSDGDYAGTLGAATTATLTNDTGYVVVFTSSSHPWTQSVFCVAVISVPGQS